MLNEQLKSKYAWIGYDFANSAYHLLIPTVLFPLYFKEFLMSDTGSVDLYWSLTVSVPILMAGVFSLFLGRIMDRLNNHKKVFVTTILIMFMATVLLGVGFSYGISILLFTISLFAFNLSQFSYNSFLPFQNQGKNLSLLSGLGWGIGYLGGIICMIPIYFLIKDVSFPEGAGQYQTGFIITAVFLLVFSLPSFLWLKKNNYKKVDTESEIGLFRLLSKNKNILYFLLAIYFINDGLSSLVFFTSLYASTTLSMATKDIFMAFLIVQIVGIPMTILVSYFADKLGDKTVLYGTIVIWVLISLLFFFIETKTHIYLLSVLVGTVIGSTPAIARAMLAKYISKNAILHSAKLFSFHAFASRASSVLGPMLFGIISWSTGDQRLAMLSLILFFILGAIFLKKANLNEKSLI